MSLLATFAVALCCVWIGMPGSACADPSQQDHVALMTKFSDMTNSPMTDVNAALHDKTLVQTIRLQLARLAEITLTDQATEENNCLKRVLCAIGVARATSGHEFQFPHMSKARGLDEFRKILEQMIQDIKESNQVDAQSFPGVHKTAASYAVGLATRNPELCENLYQCSTDAKELALQVIQTTNDRISYEGDLIARLFQGTPPQRESRATCSAISAACPGISIGCGMCAIFAPTVCGNQCIVAAIYCGSSSIACRKQKESKETRFLQHFYE